MRKEYVNFIRSKNSIERALVALLQEGHELESISVTDLSMKAGVNRGTFYNHYKSVEEVLSGIENDFMKSLSRALTKTDLSTKDGRKEFFSELTSFLSLYSKNAKAIWKYLPVRALLDLRNKISVTLKTSFPSMIGNIVVSDDFLGKVRFFVSGLIGNYLEALMGLEDDSIEKVSERAYQISNLIFGEDLSKNN